MTCHNCRIEIVKAGFYGRNQVQRWKCQTCGKRFSEPQQKPFDADVRLPVENVTMILHCLVEGNSVRSTARLCDVEKRTVLNMLKLAGENCERLLADRVRNVPVQDVQCDEIWTFVQKKEGHNLKAALALQFAYYNFCRVHGSLRVTPAMEAGIADHVWDMKELIGA